MHEHYLHTREDEDDRSGAVVVYALASLLALAALLAPLVWVLL